MLSPAQTDPVVPVRAGTSAPTAYEAVRARLRPLRRLLWLYVLLWVIEGALRKWVLPGLANPLLIVRDPVLLLIYGLAFQRGVFPKNLFVWWFAILGALALTASIMTTDVPLMIQLYGLRTSYLHLPLIFLIPAVFDGNDVRRLGVWTLACALPMAPLVFLQFVARSSSWLNAGAGGTGNGMIVSANGHIRPSGTFSFTNGLSGFTIMVAAFFLWQLFEKKLFPRLLWLAAAGALVFLIAFSGSRSVAGAVGLIVVCVVLIGFVQPRYWSSSVKLLVMLGMMVVVIGSFAVFQQGMGVFASRFGSAQNVQTGFFGRFFESLYKPLDVIATAKPLGVGLGLGTNAAAGIINDGKRAFLLAEGDMARVILESGPFIGVIYQIMRIMLAAYLGARAFGSLYQRANTLPILIFSGIVPVVLVGEFSQPTELGFATISAGICLAANKPRTEKYDSAPAPTHAPLALPVTPPPRRGRSIYAEQLHQPSPEPGNR